MRTAIPRSPSRAANRGEPVASMTWPQRKQPIGAVITTKLSRCRPRLSRAPGTSRSRAVSSQPRRSRSKPTRNALPNRPLFHHIKRSGSAAVPAPMIGVCVGHMVHFPRLYHSQRSRTRKTSPSCRHPCACVSPHSVPKTTPCTPRLESLHDQVESQPETPGPGDTPDDAVHRCPPSSRQHER